MGQKSSYMKELTKIIVITSTTLYMTPRNWLLPVAVFNTLSPLLLCMDFELLRNLPYL